MRASLTRFATTIGVALLVVGCALATSPTPVTTQPSEAPPASPSSTPAATPVDDAPKWTATGNMVTPHDAHTATLLLDRRVLVTSAGYSEVSDYPELFDLGTGTWAPTGSMDNPFRAAHTATLPPDGRVLVVGSYLAAAEVHDPGRGSWTATGDVVTRRRFATATLLLDGTVLVAAGSSGSGQLASAELYDSGCGT